MKIVQILNEYNRDISTEKWGDKLFASAQKDGTILNYTPGQGYEDQNVEKFFVLKHLLQEFEAADPTPNNKYVPWIVRKYSEQNGKLKLEDISTILSDDLDSFARLVKSKKLPVEYRDINRYKTPDEFYDVVEKFSSPEVKTQEDRGHYEEYLNNDDVRIIIPKDAQAAKFWGQGTRWCTASKKNEVTFANYGGGSPFAPRLIIIPKHPTHPGEKYQTQGNLTTEFASKIPEVVTNEKDVKLNADQISKLQHRLRLDKVLNKEKFEDDHSIDVAEYNRMGDEKHRNWSPNLWQIDTYAKTPEWLFRSPKEILRRGRTQNKEHP
jgi:hypothetical protein